MNAVMEKMRIRYIKLHFTLVILENGTLPRTKVSALRGGMGHALLMVNCIRDEYCEACDFSEDCLVQRMMYPKMKIRPDFMNTKDSEGFVIECEDTREWVHAGDELSFNLLLFGRTIVYFQQYLQAFYYFGMQGIGREHVRFQISKVTNTVGETLVEGSSIYKERYTVMLVSDYVRHRLASAEVRKIVDRDCCRLVFQSPLALKYQGEMQEHFLPEAIIAAEECSKDGAILAEGHIPAVLDEKVWTERVKRYSGTQNSKVAFNGIRGWCDLKGLEDTIELLLAGELLHIGKNTSFGFGKFTLVKE